MSVALRRHTTWTLVAASVGLLALAGTYQARGYGIFLDPLSDGRRDLQSRWQEERHILSGRTWQAAVYNRTHEEKTWLPFDGGYPPWTFATGILLFWPDWSWMPSYFAIVQLAATAVLAVTAWTIGRAHSRRSAALLVAGTLAANALCGTLITGQLGLLVAACLCGCLVCAASDRQVPAGLLLAVAMTKPTLAAPFALIFAVRGQFRLLATCGVYLAAGTLLIGVLTTCSWSEMFVRPWLAGQRALQDVRHFNLASPWLMSGFEARWALPATALAGAACATLAFARLARRPLLPSFAVAAVAARIFTYHDKCDDVVIVFLWLALGEAAWRAGHHWPLWLAFWGTGLTLWAPSRLVVLPEFKVLQIAVWLVSVGLLVALRAGGSRVHPRVEERAVAVGPAGT